MPKRSGRKGWSAGSPPRVWGQRPTDDGGCATGEGMRFTPTCVGTTANGRSPPRRPVSSLGSPPRVWGQRRLHSPMSSASSYVRTVHSPRVWGQPVCCMSMRVVSFELGSLPTCAGGQRRDCGDHDHCLFGSCPHVCGDNGNPDDNDGITWPSAVHPHVCGDNSCSASIPCPHPARGGSPHVCGDNSVRTLANPDVKPIPVLPPRVWGQRDATGIGRRCMRTGPGSPPRVWGQPMCIVFRWK